ncbi:MAG: peptidylprolyl isomerase [Anaeroplasmataceae bacterium]
MKQFMNYENFLSSDNQKVRMMLDNNMEIIIELFDKVAPITVKNFIDLVNQKYYEGIIFHRVIKGFMVQAGDKTGTGMGGSENNILGEFTINGVNNLLSHSKGVISMARTNNVNSASSQFFLVHEDSTFLDGSYAAFGVVTKGLDVIDYIASQQTNSSDKPLVDVKIKTVELL